MNEDKECKSQFVTINGVVVTCEMTGTHSIHRRDNIVWRSEHEKPYVILPKEKPIDKGPKTEVKSEELSVSEQQVGGDHYKGVDLQPIDVIDAWGLDFYEGSALKYLARHRRKNGREDIEKAIHYLQLLLERQYES